MKELIIRDAIDEYLSVSKYVNWNSDSIISKADEFRKNYADEIALVKAIYGFVKMKWRLSSMKTDRLYALTLYLLNHGKSSVSELAKHFDGG